MSFGLTGVTVAFDGKAAIEDLDLDIPPGAVTAVIGADGAGKTTTARALVGLVGPTEGTVLRPPREAIGYQPATAGTWQDLTVSENLAFAARAYRLRPGSKREAALLEVTGLGPASGRLAGALSGGMRQKLAVAMAMLPSPQLTVLDEPTTGLDPLSRAEIWKLLTRAAAEGTAVLATTTYLSEAERASHVLVLDEGSALASGTAESIVASFPGTLALSASRPSGLPSWRRGNSWRVWSADGRRPPGLIPATPDLEDVVTAAALARRGS